MGVFTLGGGDGFMGVYIRAQFIVYYLKWVLKVKSYH